MTPTSDMALCDWLRNRIDATTNVQLKQQLRGALREAEERLSEYVASSPGPPAPVPNQASVPEDRRFHLPESVRLALGLMD